METPPIKETRFYKVYCSAFFQVAFSVFGDSMAIWGTFIIANWLFAELWPNLYWPGINYFIVDGKVILISFSFLSSAMYYSTRDLRINIRNILVGIHLLASLFIFCRVIALNAIHSEKDLALLKEEKLDWIVYPFSIYVFFASICLYYWVINRKRSIENSDELTGKRRGDQDTLEGRFKKNKR